MNTSNRRLPRPVVDDWLYLTLIGWAGLVVVAVGVLIGVAWFNEVQTSAWIWASAAAPWFVAFVGGYAMHETLPMFVANGRTRRESVSEFALFGGLLVLFTTFLVTITFALERAFYSALGWSLGTIEDRLFDSHGQLHLIFVDQLLVLSVWTACGALIGASWYRSSNRGALALVVAIVLVGITGAAHGSGFEIGPATIVARLFEAPAWGVSSAIVASLAAAGIALWLTWLNVRDFPLRNR